MPPYIVCNDEIAFLGQAATWALAERLVLMAA